MPPEARSRRRTATLAALAALATLVAITAAVGESGRASHGAGSAARSGAPTASATQGPAADALRLQKAEAADRQAALDDSQAKGGSQAHPARNTWFVGSTGTYLVGRSLGAGTYKSAAPASGTCHWARLRTASGGPRHIIAAGQTARSSVVTVRKTDKFFETSGCANWQRIS
jgi:hypothetical protein